MKPTYPSINESYGRCFPCIWTAPYEYNSLLLRPSYWSGPKIPYRKYGNQESWSKRHPSAHSNEAKQQKRNAHTVPRRNDRGRKRTRRKNFYERGKWKRKENQKKIPINEYQKKRRNERGKRREIKMYSWYKRG